ncbi:Transcriptional regulator, Crp [Dehalobacter sp. UNSWDHB]|uniref:Crp/Fnr family transcriptional regulator n=1 Tax=Dehalobacter sp. UNSWDHB TaxID=1339256 RepID=UPI00038776DF|nr:helix-turn-helix domain-containing protein [Dehalobacter sp. UNSWDHB]EQB22668.1 Transcriptional regulator, Crp [Dehalobacter sp. UNSWDHB]
MEDNNKKQIPRPYMLENFEQNERLEKYLHLAHKRIFPKGAIVEAQGENANSVLYVKSGCLGVSIGSDDGCTKFLFHINEKTIGAAINSNEENSEVQIHAIRKSTVYFFALEDILEIFNEDKQVLLEVIQNILDKSYCLMTKTRDLSYYRPSSRILRFIYNLCISEGKLVDNYYIINTNLTQKTIGDITGTHYVSVSKLFKMLEQQRILKKTKDKIYIYNLPKLTSMIDEVLKY